MFNTVSNSSGIFCSKEENIRIFNADSGMTAYEFYNSQYYRAIVSSVFCLTEWINYTEEEKKTDKEKEMNVGYLKEYTYKEACKIWWDGMSADNKAIIMSMPNFDADVFRDITGIDI